VRNYDQSIKTYLWAQEHSGEFANFIQQQTAHPAYGCLSLPSLLITPVQRLPKYELLMKELLKHTAEIDPGYERLTEALETIRKVSEDVNEHLRDVETITKITDIQEQVVGLPKNLFHDQLRVFIFDDDVKCRLSKQGKDKIRHIYIFEDLIIICRKLNNKLAKNLKYQTHFCLGTAMIHTTTELLTKISFSDTTVIIAHENAALQNQWQAYLEKAKVK